MKKSSCHCLLMLRLNYNWEQMQRIDSGERKVAFHALFFGGIVSAEGQAGAVDPQRNE